TVNTSAASLSINVTTKQLMRRTNRSMARLQPASPATTPATEHPVRCFRALVQLPMRTHSEFAKAREAVSALERTPRDTRAVRAAAEALDAFLARYFDAYALTDARASKEEVLLAGDFDRIDKSALQLAVLERTVKERQIQVRFLIATLPDPIDSYTGWQFDPMLDGITQALAASDY